MNTIKKATGLLEVENAILDSYRQVALNTDPGDRAIMLAVELAYWNGHFDDTDDVPNDVDFLDRVARECNEVKASCGLTDTQLAYMLAAMIERDKASALGDDYRPVATALKLVA